MMDNATIKEIVEQAHMAGQADAKIDPSYSSALSYFNGIVSKTLPVKVGHTSNETAKEVSALNNTIYLKARELMAADTNMGQNHIGWMGLSAVVDWLERTYTIKVKDTHTVEVKI